MRDTACRRACRLPCVPRAHTSNIAGPPEVEKGCRIAVEAALRPHLKRRWVQQVFLRVRAAMASAANAKRKKVQACDVVNSVHVEAFEYSGRKDLFEGSPFVAAMQNTPPRRKSHLALLDTP